MVKEAEAHSAEDRAKREEVELRNQADHMIHQAEKVMKDNADKIPADVKSEVEADEDHADEQAGGRPDPPPRPYVRNHRDKVCPVREVRGIFAASAAGAKEPTSTRRSASRRCVTERAQEATPASAPAWPRKIADFAGSAGARPPRPRRCKELPDRTHEGLRPKPEPFFG